VIAREHSETAGINRQRFVDAKFSGEIGYRPRPQHARTARTPSMLGLLILAQAAVGVVDPAMQSEFSRARLQFRQWELVQQRNGTVIKLAPAVRIQIAKQLC